MANWLWVTFDYYPSLLSKWDINDISLSLSLSLSFSLSLIPLISLSTHICAASSTWLSIFLFLSAFHLCVFCWIHLQVLPEARRWSSGFIIWSELQSSPMVTSVGLAPKGWNRKYNQLKVGFFSFSQVQVQELRYTQLYLSSSPCPILRNAAPLRWKEPSEFWLRCLPVEEFWARLTRRRPRTCRRGYTAPLVWKFFRILIK